MKRTRESLFILFLHIKQFFKVFYDTVTGFFIYTSHFRDQQRQRQEMDTHYYFREELKRKQASWVLEERQKIAEYERRALSRKQKNDMSIHNYIVSVLMITKPKQTIPQLLAEYYSYIHPYIMGYRSAALAFKAGEERGLGKAVDKARQIMPKDDEDILLRAEKILTKHKEAVLEIRAAERKYKEQKLQKQNTFDKKMIEHDIKILEQQKRDAATSLAALQTQLKKEQKKKS